MTEFPSLEYSKVTVMGLGYIGLPLCYFLNKRTDLAICGFDNNLQRIDDINRNEDHTGFLESVLDFDKFIEAVKLTSDPKEIEDSDIFIITVPTPVDKYKNPDLSAIVSATHTAREAIESQKNLNKATSKKIIIYESTVYPSCTEEICLPILRANGLSEGIDFEICYSPERLSPGKNSKSLPEIAKIVSSNSESCSKWLKKFYSLFIDSEVHIARSIKVAEATKILENVQRDVNIALMNEVSILFRRLNIDIYDVLNMAKTKWNFLDFTPGLVGGHCIGVDPYYLLYQSRMLNCDMRLVESSRNVNQNMTGYLARSIAKSYNRKISLTPSQSKVLILGATFKPNCADFRNSQQILLGQLLSDYGFSVDLCDYHKTRNESDFITNKPKGSYNMIIFALKHDEYINNLNQIIKDHSISCPPTFIVDLQDMVPPGIADFSI